MAIKSYNKGRKKLQKGYKKLQKGYKKLRSFNMMCRPRTKNSMWWIISTGTFTTHLKTLPVLKHVMRTVTMPWSVTKCTRVNALSARLRIIWVGVAPVASIAQCGTVSRRRSNLREWTVSSILVSFLTY